MDLVEAVLHVRRTFTDGYLSVPKNHEQRDVDITPNVVDMLALWKNELDAADDTLVFPGETKSGYLDRGVAPRVVPGDEARRHRACRADGEKRTFHSFRHTYAKRALENGRRIT